MNISIRLSVQSIESAIALLSDIKDVFDRDADKVVEKLATDGAQVANQAYGDWKVDAIPITYGSTAEIMVLGDMPLIAEFGAGDATLQPTAFFEHEPDTWVYPGSYSLQHALEYAILGEWRFAGKWMSEVKPRQGLYRAKMFIIEEYAKIAREVLKL